MAKRLKGVIIGITNVMCDEKTGSSQHFHEVERLIDFLRSQNVTPVIFGNRNWKVNGVPIKQHLHSEWKDVPCIIANEDNIPRKPRRDAAEYIFEQFGWDSAEVLCLGNTDADMRFAINGNMMFLNALWYGQNNEYGILFHSPLDVGRFIDTFCLRDHLWHYAIEKPDFRFYALSPYSTRIPEFEYLSNDARTTAKSEWGRGHPEFWTRYLYSTIYFSELHKEVDWITAYPSSSPGSGNTVVEEPLLTFSKCFYKTKYLPDLIVRHTRSIKSAYARRNNKPIDHKNQLGTIVLNSTLLNPSTNKPYKRWPIKRGETVLVIDDICTQGFSLEAARAYLNQMGANVVCLSWLKTINSDYCQLTNCTSFDPFKGEKFQGNYDVVRYRYRDYIVDPVAAGELTAKLRAYDNWQWPAV